MLVLSRKLNQRIHIGDDIVIEIVDIDRNKIRIGIEAPKGLVILREELLSAPKTAPEKPLLPMVHNDDCVCNACTNAMIADLMASPEMNNVYYKKA